MAIREFFLADPANAVTALVAAALFVSGGIAVTSGEGVAGVLFVLAGFVALMFLEYRHIEGGN